MDVEDSFISIPVNGGRTLRAHLWLPVGAGRVPAIVDTNPYRSFDLSRSQQQAIYAYWAAGGYVCLCVDTMGSGNSDGVLPDEYLPEEIGDAIAVVEWCAAQDWCDGQVGMHGFSWAAFVALRAAARKPKALKALVLGGVSEDGWRTDIQHLGGVPYVAQSDWAATMLMFNSLPPDPAEVGERWQEMWLERLEANRPYLERWMPHPSRDEYWQMKAAKLAPDETPLPLLLYAGTGDKYATSVLRIADQWAGSVKTIIGPWDHTIPDFSSREPRIGFLAEGLRWWDTWLKGANNGAQDEPAYRVWIGAPDAKGQMTEGAWIAADKAAEKQQRLVLNGPVLATSGEASVIELRPNPQRAENLASDLYEDTPGVFDISARDGVVLSITDAFATDADFFGLPALEFQTSATEGEVVARLLDIAPDGTAIRITTGAINLALKFNTIAFQSVAWRVKREHKIGLMLSAEGWPTLWPSRNTQQIVVEQAHLDMPLLAATGAAPTSPEPHPPEWPKMSALKWIDADSGKLLPTELKGGTELNRRVIANHIDATGTDYCISKRFAVAPNECEGVWRAAIERPGWSVRLDTYLHVRAAPDAFVIGWMVHAESDGVNVTREGTIQIARTAF